MSPWIKIEHSTPDKPEVVTIAAQLGIDPDAVVGKLIRVWCWADLNCVKGNNIRVTSTFLDRITYQPGFATAMREAGWLTGEDGSLAFTGFDRHNGTSAKARAETNRRVAKHRNKKSVSTETIKVLQKPLPEEEEEEDKGRESTPASPASELNLQADAIAATYCRQDSPLEVRQLILDDLLLGTTTAEIRDGVARCMRHIRSAPQGSANRFVPKALSFFSERQWRSPEAFQERWSKDAPPMPSRRQTDEIPSTAKVNTLQKL